MFRCVFFFFRVSFPCDKRPDKSTHESQLLKGQKKRLKSMGRGERGWGADRLAAEDNTKTRSTDTRAREFFFFLCFYCLRLCSWDLLVPLWFTNVENVCQGQESWKHGKKWSRNMWFCLEIEMFALGLILQAFLFLARLFSRKLFRSTRCTWPIFVEMWSESNDYKWCKLTVHEVKIQNYNFHLKKTHICIRKSFSLHVVAQITTEIEHFVNIFWISEERRPPTEQAFEKLYMF